MLTQLQSQRQHQRILPQQIEMLNIFFLNSLELKQRMKNELEENPFLDVYEENTGEEECDAKLSKDDVRDFESSEESMYNDQPDSKSDYPNYFVAESTSTSSIIATITFKEDAKQQLQLMELSKTDRDIASYIIDILSPQGLMDRTVEEISDDLSFHFRIIVETAAVERGLAIVQSLDPVGIGSASIKECLLRQLHQMNAERPGVTCAILLLEDHYDDLVHRQFEKLHRVLKIDNKQMKMVLALIANLSFYPVNETYQYDTKQTIIPDFIITNSGDSIHVDLHSGKSDCVFVNQSLYRQLADHIGIKDKTASQYVKSKLKSAEWFVSAVKNRETTMMRIMRCIVAYQHEYFVSGDIKYLKPMVLKNISDKLGLDIATISRITSNKYADTPFGLIYLKKLFSEGIADKKGEVISNKVIRSVIGDAIESENKEKPYSDRDLVSLLSAKGYNIARRTVAKYRQQMQLPTSQIRAVWA